MFSMQGVSQNPSITTFQLSSAASLNLGRSQDGVWGNGLTCPSANAFNLDNFQMFVPSSSSAKVLDLGMSKSTVSKKAIYIVRES